MNNFKTQKADEGDFWAVDHGMNQKRKSKILLVKDKHGLCEDLKYVISVPDLCDVTFLVGPERLPVYGVKAIVATRSRHLYQLLLAARKTSKKKPEKKSGFQKALDKIKHLLSPESSSNVMAFYQKDVIEKLTVEIKNFDVKAFERFIRYVHCGTVSVDIHNVIGLMNAAHTYDFPELRDACWDFAVDNINHDTIATLMSSASAYVHFKPTRMIMQRISAYIRDQPDILQESPELCQNELAPPCKREYLL